VDPNLETGPIDIKVPTPASDRRTARWDLKNAAGNYASLIGAQVVSAVFSLASVWFITRFLGSDGYGWAIAVIAASQLAQVFVNWTVLSLPRFGVEEFVLNGHINHAFWARTAIFLPNTLVLLALSSLWLPIVQNWLKLPSASIWLAAAHFAVSATWLHVQHALQAAKLPRLQAVLLAIERVSIFAFLLISWTLGRLDVTSAIVAYIAGPLMMLMIGLFGLRNVLSWRIDIRRETIVKILRFSLPLIPYSLMAFVSTNFLDAIFISQYLSKADLGVYSIAYQFNGILMQFPLIAGTLLLPLFVTLRTSGKYDRVIEYMENVLPVLTFIGGLAGVSAAVVMKFFIPFVFGAQVSDAVVIFGILISSSVLAIPIFTGFSPYTNALSATYLTSLLAGVSAIINFAGDYILIPRYGLKGCAWATVLAYGGTVLVILFVLKGRYKLRHRWTIPAFVPVLTASVYASATNDLITSFFLAFGVSFVIVLIWRRSIADGIRVLEKFKTFAFGGADHPV
jgi:O-antigen/teichoic acid export membrane protein